jgi:hypothetical protein
VRQALQQRIGGFRLYHANRRTGEGPLRFLDDPVTATIEAVEQNFAALLLSERFVPHAQRRTDNLPAVAEMSQEKGDKDVAADDDTIIEMQRWTTLGWVEERRGMELLSNVTPASMTVLPDVPI